MKKFLLAAVAVTMVAAGATATAQQDRYVSYSLPLDDGCGFVATSDGTETSQTAWEGEFHLVAIATNQFGPDLAGSIHVACELRINGATPGTFVSSKYYTGVAVDGGQLGFNAHPDDVVTMCTHINFQVPPRCHRAITRPVVPAPVAEAIDDVKESIDDLGCRHIASMSGGLADQPPAFDIRSDGDLYVDFQLVWDCPPYDSSGS